MQGYPNYLNINQNPYMDNRMAQLQQMQQSLQPQPNYSQFPPGFNQMPNQYQPMGISGRIVDDFNSITANDVPMDNFGAIFVKSDGTELQRKVWDKNGRIVTTHFKAVTSGFDGKANNLSETINNFDVGAFNEVIGGLNGKIDRLSERIDEFLKPKTISKAKKESDGD